MAAYNKFEDFAEQLGKGVHQLHAAGHQLEVYLTNAAPNAALDAVKADLAEITIENGYSGPEDIQNDYSETGGTGAMTGVDVIITAVGGTIGPFQYVVMQNTTPTSPLDPLVSWWDYGSPVTLQDGESFTVDFGAEVLNLN